MTPSFSVFWRQAHSRLLIGPLSSLMCLGYWRYYSLRAVEGSMRMNLGFRSTLAD